MSGALLELATPAHNLVVEPTLLCELPAGALQLAAAIASNRWPITVVPLGEGLELRALAGPWGLAELRCEGFTQEILRLPPGAIRTALGRHSDAAMAAIWAGPEGGLLLRTMSDTAAVATLLPRDGGDPLPPFPTHPEGTGPAKFSPTLLGRLMGQIRQVADEITLQLGTGPDQPLTATFAAEGITGRVVLAPIHRRESDG